MIHVICRDCPGHDLCNKSGHGNVLGHLSLECHGDHGESPVISHCYLIYSSQHLLLSVNDVRLWVLCGDGVILFPCHQEAYSVARQFNLIPPVCEQAEYHYFQRDKVEVQLPELYHKIGQSSTLTQPSEQHRISSQQDLCLSLSCLGVGAMTWSPLACGLITGKYSEGVPDISRANMKVSSPDKINMFLISGYSPVFST